jgi:hypothetical protein
MGIFGRPRKADRPVPAHERPTDPKPVAELVDRRRRVQRCVRCHAWVTLVFMRNGGDYCVPCAKRLRDLHGTTPAGRRATDITDLGNQPWR